MKTGNLTTALAGALLLLGSGPAGALMLDFDLDGNGAAIVHGQDVANAYAALGVTITTTNVGGGPNLGIAFDSELSNTSDSDLEHNNTFVLPGWDAGNLGTNIVLNNILIIAENDVDQNNDGIYDDPDDEGSRPAGTFAIDFGSDTYSFFEFDLLDVESSTMENGHVQFFLNGVSTGAAQTFDAFLGLGQGVVYGNNSANHIDLGDVGLYDEVRIKLGGSGGVDNINAAVPEPSAALLFGLGFATAGAIRRRRGAPRRATGA